MSLDECLRRIELAVNSDQLNIVLLLPKEFVGFEMEMGVDGGLGNLLPDHGHQLAMMKDACIKFFLPRVQSSFMKRDFDFDWSFDPASQCAIPFIFPAVLVDALTALPTHLPTQLSIYKPPILACDILQMKFRMSNYLEKILEARP